MCNINCMTTGETSFGTNQAAKLEQAQQMASSLNNLANALIQKNATINKLVATKATLTKAIADIQLSIAQMCAAKVPTPQCWSRFIEGGTCLPLPLESHQTSLGQSGYCWSHGYNVKVGHNSSTCSSHRTGHQPSATQANIMGGSTYHAGYPTPATPLT
jgi:hypothetical protein